MYSIVFVCLGNICRSPTAEGVFRKKAQIAGIEGQLRIDSAGTSAYHAGDQADLRSQQEAKTFGYDLSTIRSRQVLQSDFDDFDMLIAMDKSNLDYLQSVNPDSTNGKLSLFLGDFLPDHQLDEVPDPYYGGIKGFTEVVELIEQASDNLINHLKDKGYVS